MLYRQQKITIIKVRRPHRSNINEELQWFGTSLGLFGLRDKDKSCFRLFIELLKSNKDLGLTSDEIGERLGLSRGTVVHHLRKLMDAGLVVQQKNRYLLRVENLSQLIAELERDLKRTCEDLKDIAREIDRTLGI
ncbi:ArsR family transcriptional regulator [Candidatus Woesearchaeota archaeon]|nr:ArsR family transcriptional regulator [Candidatus Woesearchaeota archaeon]